MPLWCAMITRIVKPKSEEAQCEGAKKAIRAELEKMMKRKVWDIDDVYSLQDLLRDPNVKEAMLGRAFQILGVKGEELGEAEQVWKGRIVFQGSNIRTKSGTAAVELFEEVSNVPAYLVVFRVLFATQKARTCRPCSTRRLAHRHSLSCHRSGGRTRGSTMDRLDSGRNMSVLIAVFSGHCMDIPRRGLSGRRLSRASWAKKVGHAPLNMVESLFILHRVQS